MSEPVEEGMEIVSQAYGRRAAFESLKDLINRFLKNERYDFNIKFDNYLRVTRNEFNELLGDYESGGYHSTNTFINGELIYEGTYNYLLDDNNKHVITFKIIRIAFHKEKYDDMTIFAIHQIEGSTWKAGIKIEDNDEDE